MYGTSHSRVGCFCGVDAGEQTRTSSCQVFTEIPAIAKAIVELDEFHAFRLSQSQLITASGIEIVDDQ